MSIIDRLEATLAAGSDNAQLRFGLASACLREGRFADARRHAEVAVEHDPDYSAAWRLLGQALVELGEVAAAESAFENGLAIAREKGDMQLVRELNVFLKRLQRAKEK